MTTGLLGDQRGGVMVEMALIVPFLMILVTGIVQMGFVFFLQNNMMSVANDAARRVVVGELSTMAAATHAESALVGWGSSFDVQVTEPGDDVVVNITVPLADAVFIDYLGLFDTGDLEAEVTARK